MKYYAIQVKTRGEEKYLKLAEELIEEYNSEHFSDLALLWPRRKFMIRKMGKSSNSLEPIFPGYIFLRAQAIEPKLYWGLKTISGFYRFLPSNNAIKPIEGRDHSLLLQFLTSGEIIGPSPVYFDENDRIVVVSGPLKGYEGSIVKVDRRKQRVKVRLTLFKSQHLVDFGFQLIEPAKEEGTAKD